MELYTFFAKDSSKTESQMKLSYNRRFHLIECFHSRGQHLCKFIGTKESICIREEFNSHKIGMAAVSLFWDTNMATVTSCVNSLLLVFT